VREETSIFVLLRVTPERRCNFCEFPFTNEIDESLGQISQKSIEEIVHVSRAHRTLFQLPASTVSS